MTFKHLLAAFGAAALACAAAPAFAQDDAEAAAAEPAAEAAAAEPAADDAAAPAMGVDPADVESIDAIMAATYDAISGPAGQERDWDRFYSLFAPNATLVAVGDGQIRLNASPEGYVERSGPFLTGQGFIEEETGRRTERYGNVVHVFSAYEGTIRPGANDEDTIRGVNSFQLAFADGRWWIVNILWEGETDDNPVPEEMIGVFE